MSDEIIDDVEVPELPDPSDIPKLGDFKMPSVEELLQALERMDGLTDENKQELRESLLARGAQGNPNLFPGPTPNNSGTTPDMLVLFSLITIILLVFVFFGYKLYKSLADREKRKEEKRRQKQQKKKK